MMNLQSLLEAIDHLPGDALEQVEQRLVQRRHDLERAVSNGDDPEAWIANLHSALEEFREGLSEHKLNEIAADMNIGYISPKELVILEQLASDLEETE